MTSGEAVDERAEAALDSSVCWCTHDSTCVSTHDTVCAWMRARRVLTSVGRLVPMVGTSGDTAAPRHRKCRLTAKGCCKGTGPHQTSLSLSFSLSLVLHFRWLSSRPLTWETILK